MKDTNSKLLATSRGPVEYMDTGNGEVVLSLHGAMGGYDQAHTLARTIGEIDHRYLALSRPGYLGTPIAAGRTPEEQADLYAEAIDLLHIGQVIVFAISGGGPSAIHFALRHRDKCRGLVLVSTLGGRANNKIPPFFHVLTLLAGWPAFVRIMRNRTESNLKQTLSRSISDPAILERTLMDADAMALYKEVTIGSFYRMAERIKGTRNDIKISRTRTYPLKDIAVPTLVIHGTEDRLVSFEEHGMRLATEIPGAELFAAEGGEHVTIFTHRREVQERVSAFVHGLYGSKYQHE
ncbi:MAG TPA: alpha/beta hydrolase [Thermodesulfovibrionales bacterium]|nr:alpha/beta hydrolase [Thermodesulfovibrionales bacterium]